MPGFRVENFDVTIEEGWVFFSSTVTSKANTFLSTADIHRITLTEASPNVVTLYYGPNNETYAENITNIKRAQDLVDFLIAHLKA